MIRLLAGLARFAFRVGVSAFGLLLTALATALAPFIAVAAALFLIARALGIRGLGI